MPNVGIKYLDITIDCHMKWNVQTLINPFAPGQLAASHACAHMCITDANRLIKLDHKLSNIMLKKSLMTICYALFQSIVNYHIADRGGGIIMY